MTAGSTGLCDISQVVRTGTYYIIVQVSTGRYVPVRTDMYQVYRIPDVAQPCLHLAIKAKSLVFQVTARGEIEMRLRRSAPDFRTDSSHCHRDSE